MYCPELDWTAQNRVEIVNIENGIHAWIQLHQAEEDIPKIWRNSQMYLVLGLTITKTNVPQQYAHPFRILKFKIKISGLSLSNSIRMQNSLHIMLFIIDEYVFCKDWFSSLVEFHYTSIIMFQQFSNPLFLTFIDVPYSVAYVISILVSPL